MKLHVSRSFTSFWPHLAAFLSTVSGGDTVQRGAWESTPEAEQDQGQLRCLLTLDSSWGLTGPEQWPLVVSTPFLCRKSLLGLLTISPGERPDLAFLSGYLVTHLLAYKENNLSKDLDAGKD